MAKSLDDVQDIFEAALSRPEAERKAFLEEQCGDDEGLLDEVSALLSADALAGTFKRSFVVEFPPTEVPDDSASTALVFRSGDKVGPYEILKPIGHGGFAVVYLAQQEHPVRRRVALKILKSGMDTQEVLGRFEAERQALALMEHPHIAKVLDAGATDRGLPFFAMEYVEGISIVEYCDENRLTIKERLALFILLCEAVQHAHLKAVIHRDLKPSNVLVVKIDGQPVPKVIDFGVAKAIEQKLTPETIQTRAGDLIGTPIYMSPEQVDALNDRGIDTRVDVYALGVILYELLAGRLPFDMESVEAAGLLELLRAIREDEAPRPSTVVKPARAESTLSARRRRTDLPTLARELSGDLDWIALKALEKDRDRRYGSPKRLAEDIERYLADEPILARPPSAIYRAGKFVRRNLVAVFAGAAFVVFLVVFAVAMAIQASRITAERDQARRARAELAQVVRFQAQRLGEVDAQLMGVRMRTRLLAEARTSMQRAGVAEAEIRRRTTTLEQLLAGANFTNLAVHTLEENIFKTGLESVAERFKEQPLVKARLLQSLATEMRDAGLLQSATGPQREALAIRQRALGEGHPDALESLAELGRLLGAQGKLDEAEDACSEALRARRRVLGEGHASTLRSTNDMGELLQAQGKLQEAEAYLRRALDGTRNVLGDEHPETVRSIRSLGSVLNAQGRSAEAEPYYQEVLTLSRRVLGDEHPDTIESINNMGFLLYAMGKPDEVEPYYREALEANRRVLGDEHPNTLLSYHNLAFLLQGQSKFSEAERYYREALEGRRRVLGDDHADTLASVNNLGFLMKVQGKLDEAERYFARSLEGLRRTVGEEHPSTLVALINLGTVVHAKGSLTEAERYIREALDAGRRGLGGEHPITLIATSYLAELLNGQSKYLEAERLARASLPTQIKVFGNEHWRTGWARSVLGEALAGLERYDEAEKLLLEGYAALAASVPPARRYQKLTSAVERLEALYSAWAKPDQAAKWHAKRPPKSRPAK